MRISLLLDREPFGEILQQTLSKYWRQRFARDFHVRWDGSRTHREAVPRHDTQMWLCNTYLNAIFTPRLPPPALEPIRQEFTRSVAAWKRPWQRWYVQLATGQGTAGWLATARMWVSPAVPDSDRTLIVPGNRKIRLLNHEQETCVAVQKAGFAVNWLRTEVAARQQAAGLGLPVPELLSHDLDSGWFAESYVCGTPLNRLPPGTRYDAANRATSAAIGRLTQATAVARPAGEYREGLYERVRALLDELGEQGRSAAALGELAGRLYEDLRRRGGPREMLTALTHGDLQPANVLESEHGIWLIDWERAARRQQAYDGLVFLTASRFPKGLARRLEAFVQGLPSPASQPAQTAWPGIHFLRAEERRRQVALFLLEELNWHLEENSDPALTSSTAGLALIQQETHEWLDQNT